MNVKEALETFFENNTQSWKRVWGTAPRIPITEKYLNSGLIIEGSINKENEGEWLPKLQTSPIDFSAIELKLGFNINPQLKDFLSTYWFMPLEGKTTKIDHIVLNEVLPNIDLAQNICNYFNRNDFHYLNEGEYYMIGGFCCINGDDSYLVIFNNENGQITAVHNFDKKSIIIAESISDLLNNMKGIWDII